MPEGMFLELPKPTQEGEIIPPVPCEFAVGLTALDSKGHRWAILRVSDHTVSVELRIPWQLAGQIGQQIAAGLQAVMQKAASEASGGLIVPGGGKAGGLLIPTVGPPAGGRRG